MSDVVRIPDMPDLGTVTDASSVVGEGAGSGRYAAIALKTYATAGLAMQSALDTESAARIAAATGMSAQSFGVVGNGITDDTVALQAAINGAIQAQEALYIPGGQYLISAPLTVTGGVRIVGAYAVPLVAANAGTWIVLDGTHLVSAFSIASTAVGVDIGHLGVIHAQPVSSSGWAPYNYPPAIDVPAGQDVTLHDLTLLNPTIGIRASGAPGGRIAIERVRGQPLTQGIVVDNQTDVMRISGCHFSTCWSTDANVLAHQLASGTAFQLGHCKVPMFRDNFAGSYYAFVAVATTTSGGVVHARFVNCFADNVSRFCAINDSTGGHDLAFTNCVASGGSPASLADACLIAGAGSSSVLRLTGCSLSLFGGSILAIDSTGTGNEICATNCAVTYWDQGATGLSAMRSSAYNSVMADSTTEFYSDHSGSSILLGPGYCVREPITSALYNVIVPGAATSVTVSHSLGAPPAGAMLTPRTPIGGAVQYWWSADATTFTITVTAAPGGSGINFDVLLMNDGMLF